MANEPKATFRKRLQEWVQDRSGGPLQSLNDSRRSHWMTKFFVSEVLRPLNPGLLPEDEEDLDTAFLDGCHDSGVDFFWRADGHVVIIQAKYRAADKTEKRDHFEGFRDVLRRLHPTHGADFAVAARVREAAAYIDWDKDTFSLYFVTLTRKSPEIEACEAAGAPPLKGLSDLPDRVELVYYSEPKLNDHIRDALSASEGITRSVDLLLSRNGNGVSWLRYTNPDGRESYIATINAGQLRNLYQEHRHRLFSSNIRNYIGDTATNRQIRETAIEDPGNFFFFNNGISAIATEIYEDPDGQTLRCERMSIINGAQPVRSLVST